MDEVKRKTRRVRDYNEKIAPAEKTWYPMQKILHS